MADEMKSLKELMAQLGFRPGANEKVARAFIENLRQASKETVVDITTPQKEDKTPPTQLSLFDVLENKETKKSS